MIINNTKKSLEIIVPVSKYYVIILFVGIIFFATISKLIIQIKNFDQINYMSFLIFLLILFILFNYLLWLLNGKEKIIIDSNSVELIKTNGILTFSKKYQKITISKIILVREVFDPKSFMEYYRELIKEHQRIFPFWINVGRIKFTHKMKTITFFNGLNDSELNTICETINSEIETRNK